jgi:hypothetical protein
MEIPDVTDSPQFNVIQPRPPPTHYVSVAVPTTPLKTTEQYIKDMLQKGAILPPPANVPIVFRATQLTPLLQEVIQRITEDRTSN